MGSQGRSGITACLSGEITGDALKNLGITLTSKKTEQQQQEKTASSSVAFAAVPRCIQQLIGGQTYGLFVIDKAGQATELSTLNPLRLLESLYWW